VCCVAVLLCCVSGGGGGAGVRLCAELSVAGGSAGAYGVCVWW
jgi:hypothetical protein